MPRHKPIARPRLTKLTDKNPFFRAKASVTPDR